MTSTEVYLGLFTCFFLYQYVNLSTVIGFFSGYVLSFYFMAFAIYGFCQFLIKVSKSYKLDTTQIFSSLLKLVLDHFVRRPDPTVVNTVLPGFFTIVPEPSNPEHPKPSTPEPPKPSTPRSSVPEPPRSSVPEPSRSSVPESSKPSTPRSSVPEPPRYTDEVVVLNVMNANESKSFLAGDTLLKYFAKDFSYKKVKDVLDVLFDRNVSYETVFKVYNELETKIPSFFDDETLCMFLFTFNKKS